MSSFQLLKGRVMGTLLALVCPCFRKNEIVTWKIVSFLCGLDIFLLKNVVGFLFGNQISKWRLFKKRATFDLIFTFLVTREKTQRFLQHISHLHKFTFLAHPIGYFCLTNIAKMKNLSCIISLWCDSWCWFLFTPFWSNQ